VPASIGHEFDDLVHLPGTAVLATGLASGLANVRSDHASVWYHRSMADTRKLIREVLPPQKPQSGLGVMIVAATAMFFAVASSAFLLRARMARSCPGAAPHEMPAMVTFEPPAAAPTISLQTPAECAPIVRRDDSGKETYYFRPCSSLQGDVKLELLPAVDQ